MQRLPLIYGSRGSAVGIATDYGLRLPRSRSLSPRGVKNFRFSISSIPAQGPTQPPVKWVPWPLSPVVKWPRREAEHSPATIAENKQKWIYTSTNPRRLHVVVLNW
jgi:hypothetical protein